jgi:hypothetical protein
MRLAGSTRTASRTSLGLAWVIENRAGASNTLGAAEVARAAPDGTTPLTNADIRLMAKHVMRQVPYDPLADFSPISRWPPPRWLEAFRVMAAGNVKRDAYFVALTGHELGLLGIDAYIERRPDLCEAGACLGLLRLRYRSTAAA